MMKYILTLLAFFLFNSISAQNTEYWKRLDADNTEFPMLQKNDASSKIYGLNLEALNQVVKAAPEKNAASKSYISAAFPDVEGNLQNFKIYKQPNLSPELQTLHPEINSYYGESTDGKSSKIYFAISPLGLYSMQLRLGKEAVFIESANRESNHYRVYRGEKKDGKFICTTQQNSSVNGLSFSRIFNANDATLRTYRLALSCTGEYTQYFGGTKALALAAMNNTMTRVNGVFENDFAIRMELIPQQENIIFLNPQTDPYSNSNVGANGEWNTELMDVLHGSTYGIGDAAFDIGHLFGATGGGGNAGCIGCVCNNNTNYDPSEGFVMYKGQGYTSPEDNVPSGDFFDIDYVSHEMGHQFGANHTFTNYPELTDAQVEPGSGSTIMGYAGITTEDLQAHSDPYFHAVSIEQVTSYIRSSKGNCSSNTPTGNTSPVADAGTDYTIPKNTPFLLTGKGTDANNDLLTFTWEQMDVQNTSSRNPSETKTEGPAFRSYPPTISPTRYFPKMSTLLAGETKTMGAITRKTLTPIPVEILPTVKRQLKFRFTVRDNKNNGAANASDNMVVNVDDAYGPLKVTSQNTAGISYPQKARITVTWNVAQTNMLASDVDVLFSPDRGETWIPLAEKVPNDGSQAVIIPNVVSNNCRFMVKGSGNIFFNINTADFEVTLPVNKDIAIAPNPVNGDILYIKNRWDILEYEIYDPSGKLIRKAELINNEVNVSDLRPGVYLLKLDDTTKRFIKK